MYETIGLKLKDFDTFRESLIKANRINLIAMKGAIEKELKFREWKEEQLKIRPIIEV